MQSIMRGLSKCYFGVSTGNLVTSLRPLSPNSGIGWAIGVRSGLGLIECVYTLVVFSPPVQHWTVACGEEPACVHDVANVLEANRWRLPVALAGDIDRVAVASRRPRRNRGLTFPGAEDLTPSEFYREPDATEARDEARFVVERARQYVPGP